jgi:hypothetical protein
MNLSQSVANRRTSIESAVGGTIRKIEYRPDFSPADKGRKLKGSVVLTMIRKGWVGIHMYDVFLTEGPALEVVNMDDWDLLTLVPDGPVDRHKINISEEPTTEFFLSRRTNHVESPAQNGGLLSRRINR